MFDFMQSYPVSFGVASRLNRYSGRIGLLELFALMSAGIGATASVAFLPPLIRVPGHTILHAALPIMIGIATVPRLWSGIAVSGVAFVVTSILLTFGIGHLQTAAIAGLLAFGPCISLALQSAKGQTKWLCLRLAIAGVAANIISFIVRWVDAWLSSSGNVLHNVSIYGGWAFFTFCLSGLAAGLLGGFLCFQNTEFDRE